jgi:pimeloyl-ACP methyl ester carboxylesterase
MAWSGAVILVLLLLGPFLLSLPPLEDTVLPIELAQPGDLFAEVNGVEVRYRLAGAGEPVFVLLHGFGANADSWVPVMDELASLGQVAAFDRVGFGLTERPLEWEGADPYSGPAQVALTLGLMDRLGVGRAVLVGHSAGAAVALAMALDHADRVSGLVLEAPAVESRYGVVRLLASTPQGRRVAQFVVRRTARRIDDLLASAYHDPARITDEIREAYRRPLRADHWDEGLALFVAAPGLASPLGRLDELARPVLVVTGDDDGWVGTEATIQLAGEIPGAGLVIVPACGHIVHEECPAAFIDAFSGWNGPAP